MTVRKDELEGAVLCQVRKMADVLAAEQEISRTAQKEGRVTVLEKTVAEQA